MSLKTTLISIFSSIAILSTAIGGAYLLFKNLSKSSNKNQEETSQISCLKKCCDNDNECCKKENCKSCKESCISSSTICKCCESEDGECCCCCEE